ncbi:unnamed protein product [Vitrella brassicaformis CCMP3155]|uniref:T-complex protein 1 subunit alpha n=1 Tax=Vitrella brassicaformis (strain CCMP3155) TaxID=1169540 RepID=A0A0G4FU32_VITBC|nr:unnamed protein product [Vitrella brassicaformis CCMP3155]|eukprot:CEM18473.1 unnamed protein product [Vitrella brassicaformis CCMP3155]
MHPSVGVFGERESGQDVRGANVTAVATLANILRSSLGPQGLDKMLVDDIGDVVITNDGATILGQLEVQHPAAKVMVELSHLQDQEVGDGTTSVVIIAAELLKRGNDLVRGGIHPTSVIAGYKLAMKECVKYMQENLCVKVDQLGKEVLLNVARTTISSKYIGAESDFFAHLVVDAISSVKFVTERGATRYPVKAINVLKCHGKSTRESMIVPGYGLQLQRAAQGMPTRVSPAKIAMVDFNLNRYRAALGVQVQVTDPKELERIRQKEMDITKDKISKILSSGANVILTTKGIDDMCLKYFVEAKAIAVRRVTTKDIRRIAKATGGHVCLTLATLDGDEKFDPGNLGHADEVCEERVGDNDFIFIKGCKSARSTSLLLRGANEFMLDEVERSVHDALCAVSRTLESNYVCAGGGAVETALAIYLEDFARTLGSREQLAIAEFAEALQVIPKQLAINAALDATDLLAKLRSHHAAAQTAAPTDEKKKDLKWCGLDLVHGKVRNSMKDGVLEPLLTKSKAIRFATEAAVTILRIDDLIKTIPEPEPRQGEEDE